MQRRSLAPLAIVVAGLLVAGGCDSQAEEGENVTDITVLFAYTPAAADSMGDVQAFIARAVDETNDVYRQGDIPIRLVPVLFMAVEADTSDRLVVLRRLLDPADGYIDAVHQARDQSEADLVVLVSELRSATINAAVLATPETAFAIVWFGGLGAPFFAMAHEIGHLQGARHEVVRDPADEPFPYGHGYRGDVYRTIMGGGPLELAPRFSGPDQEFGGVVLGDSTTTNVARVLRETAAYVSNFRGPRTPTDFIPRGSWPTLP